MFSIFRRLDRMAAAERAIAGLEQTIRERDASAAIDSERFRAAVEVAEVSSRLLQLRDEALAQTKHLRQTGSLLANLEKRFSALEQNAARSDALSTIRDEIEAQRKAHAETLSMVRAQRRQIDLHADQFAKSTTALLARIESAVQDNARAI